MMKAAIRAVPLACLLWLAVVCSASAAQLSAGSFVFDGQVTSIVRHGDTTFVAGGFEKEQAPTGGGLIVSQSGSGAPDPATFPAVAGRVDAVASDGAGGWYVGGDFRRVGNQARRYLAHVLADGSLDPSWDPSPNGKVGALAVLGSTVYAGGEFTSIGGQSRNRLAALDAVTGDATAWNPNPAGGLVYVGALAGAGSTLYVGGGFTSIGGQSRKNLAAIDAVSGNATAWNPGPNSTVHELALAGSTVYVSGDFSTIGGQSRTLMAALDTATGNATAFNPAPSGGFGVAPKLAVSGSTVYAAGLFTSIGGQSRSNVAALDATTGSATSWNPGTNGIVHALAVSGSTVYVGGSFSSAGGQSRSNVAALDTSTGNATAWNPETNDSVRVLAAAGSNVYVGGEFYGAGPALASVAGVAKLNATGDLDTSWNPAPDDVVEALAVSGSTVLAGGRFTTIGGQPRNGLAALDASTGNATSFDPAPSDSYVEVQALALSNSTLYVGGQFEKMGGAVRNDLAAVDLATGSARAWNPGPDNIVGALAVSGPTVYAAGAFSSIGGQSRNKLAALDAATGNATSWNPNPNSSAFGTGAISVSGSTVYTSGDFTAIGGQPRNGLAALDAATGNATAFDPKPSGGFGAIGAIAVSGSAVYVGGDFTSIGGQPRDGLAALDAATGNATSFDAELTGGYGGVMALAVTGSTVYAGGAFSAVNGSITGPLAILNDSAQPPADTTAPETTITSGPADGSAINDNSPAFQFSASEAGSSFVCKVDAGPWVPCSTGFTTAALSDGQHTVAVAAVDPATNQDATPATRTFTVDTVPPHIALTTPAEGQHFTRGAAVGTVFSCVDDGGSGVVACTAPETLDTIAVGEKSFTVTATDAAGNVATVTVLYRVDAAAPIDGGQGAGPGPSGGADPPAVATSPKIGAPTRATRRAIARGVTLTADSLKARSAVTVLVRLRSKTLARLRSVASTSGRARLKLKLSSKQLARLRGKTLTLRYAVTTADGKSHIVVRRLKVV